MKKLTTPAEVAVVQQTGNDINRNTPEAILSDESEQYLFNEI